MTTKNVIFLILIILIILILILASNSVTFLTKKQTQELFDNNYFQHFNKKNILARNIKKPLKIHYQENCLEFSDREINNINKIIKNLRKLNNHIFFNEWKFSLVTNKIELGLPHTHYDVILLSNDLVNDLNVDYGSSLFIHEKTHVLQRKYPEIFHELYSKWGFIKVNEIKNFDKLKDINRVNPDGLNINWIFSYNNKYILPLAIFRGNKLTDCINVGIYLNKNGEQYYIPDNFLKKPLLECHEYMIFFKNVNSNNYHPNELSAEFMSNYWNLGQESIKFNNKGEIIFARWCSKYLKYLK
jgi:hypothetical protein